MTHAIQEGCNQSWLQTRLQTARILFINCPRRKFNRQWRRYLTKRGA